MEKKSKIFVAGASGLVGSSLVRELQGQGFNNILKPTREELNLNNEGDVKKYFQLHKPEFVFVAAAKVGGIHANSTYPVQFLTDNLRIELNLIESAWEVRSQKLLFLGSSCIYPRLAKQPMLESELLNGPLEPTNSAYAIAKIAGIMLCQSYHRQYGANFISVMPTNLYGLNDNYHPENSHVIPGLIRRIHEAKINNLAEVVVWGTGKPLREFLFADDLANACVFLMKSYNSPEIINVGSEDEIQIGRLAELVAECVGYTGKICLDPTKPDGSPRKKVNCEKIFSLGWRPRVSLKEGLQISYRDFLLKDKKWFSQ